MHNSTTIYSCYNSGRIKTTTTGSINQNYLAGGIAGYISAGGKNNIVTISSCYNTGDIYGYTATSGITALNESAGKYYLNNNYTIRSTNRKR